MSQSSPTTSTPACPVSGLGGRFDPFDGEPTRIYPLYAEARRAEPVFYVPEIDYWVVTRFDDVRAALGGDPEVFSAAVVLDLVTPLCPAAGRIAQEHGIQISPSVVDEDPPIHTRHRKSLHKPFARGRMRAMEPLVHELVERRLAELAPRGEMDLVADFLFEIPAYILFELFGVPRSELANVRRFAQRLAVLGFGRPREDEQVAMMQGLAEFWDYCRAHVARLIATPGDDAMSEFIRGLQAPDSDEPLDPDYVTTVCFQLFFAGHETTVNATAGGMRALLENRAQWAELCADPTLIDNTVEECLRYAPSVPAWRRVTRQPVTLSGVDLPAGARLLVAIGSANRDESHFQDGERFDIHRANAREHMAFGFGRHLCLGADLARIEMRVIIAALARHLPHLELVAEQDYSYSPNTSHRGPEHVQVRWDPAANPPTVPPA
ncbi:MAG: cytochrome P450 [Gammaproteobacteria bacterium]